MTAGVLQTGLAQLPWEWPHSQDFAGALEKLSHSDSEGPGEFARLHTRQLVRKVKNGRPQTGMLVVAAAAVAVMQNEQCASTMRRWRRQRRPRRRRRLATITRSKHLLLEGSNVSILDGFTSRLVSLSLSLSRLTLEPAFVHSPSLFIYLTLASRRPGGWASLSSVLSVSLCTRSGHLVAIVRSGQGNKPQKWTHSGAKPTSLHILAMCRKRSHPKFIGF